MNRNVTILIIVIVLVLGSAFLIANNRIKEGKNEENTANNTEIVGYVEENTEITNPYVTELEDGQKENNSPEIKKEKQFKKIEVTNINFVYNPGNDMTTITADLTNSGTEEQQEEIVTLRIIGQNGEEITTLDAIIPSIAQGETRKLRCSVTMDLSNASNFEIVEK